MNWMPVGKCDKRCVALADRHYSRQKPGSQQFCRPGYNQVLYLEQKNGRSAVFVWWRPKWEAGIERMDKLRAIECTIFRNETRYRSSKLIRAAIEWLPRWNRLPESYPDGIITSVNSVKTTMKRSDEHDPGWCFIQAGFVPLEHAKSIACDTWLKWQP